jgi:hypothetical protein
MRLARPLPTLTVAITLVAGLLIGAPPVHAAEGGGSNYAPGLYGDFGVAVAPEPGFYLRHDLYFYGGDGGGARFTEFGEIRADLEADAATYIFNGLKVLDRKVLGGRYAFGGCVPVVYSDLSANVVVEDQLFSIDADRAAIGDMGIIPVSLFWTFGNLHLNVYESIIAPTGSYDPNRDVDAGLNYWSFDTNVALTYLNPKSGFEISFDLGHIYNTENSDTDYQTGQEIHLDYMVNKFLSDTFALGLQGFFYEQITGDSGSGALLGDFEGEAAGIGPALMWTTKVKKTDLTIGVKWLHEYHTEKRLEGDHLYLNFTFSL